MTDGLVRVDGSRKIDSVRRRCFGSSDGGGTQEREGHRNCQQKGITRSLHRQEEWRRGTMTVRLLSDIDILEGGKSPSSDPRTEARIHGTRFCNVCRQCSCLANCNYLYKGLGESVSRTQGYERKREASAAEFDPLEIGFSRPIMDGVACCCPSANLITTVSRLRWPLETGFELYLEVIIDTSVLPKSTWSVDRDGANGPTSCSLKSRVAGSKVGARFGLGPQFPGFGERRLKAESKFVAASNAVIDAGKFFPADTPWMHYRF